MADGQPSAPPAATPLAGAVLRANPSYELLPLDRLAAPEREQVVREHGDAEELYGVLRPRGGSQLDPRAVSPETALLLLTLREPGPLPRYAAARGEQETAQALTRLVLDDVLQVEHGGDWLSGAAAATLLLATRSAGGRGRVGELSLAALRYGAALGPLPEPLLARRLYFYGVRPPSARLRREWGDPGAHAARLGLDAGGGARAVLRAGWSEVVAPDGERRPWRQWRRQATGAAAPPRADWKLYVSPTADALPEAFAAVAETLARSHGVSAFKVGGDLRGISRPDKLVAYFDGLDDLREGAALLRERLAGCPAQGVPFTAPITSDGLLSWGADPPAASGGQEHGERSSWRLWIAERLAQYLSSAARERRPDGLEPWRFALERLRLSGVDTDTWAPAAGMWPEALASA
ncbi:hypothetical protein VSS74_15450 [Conexibacter stalactiti]|uniref:Uncharacterized protein n=1 Tax=Conexibacter stalactiti TaxID=1940611 RepID=A0ABU4HTB1_9ACTN|nr:hypothetical protein [Conexibacter stalactiti]MDW5595745.1 hypothetical protein [Conexibacter stalactiti]MEC5036387.1 hypothetical protein [Conexibacter stalactiti]